MVVEVIRGQQEAAPRAAAEICGDHSPVPGHFLRGGCLAVNVEAVTRARSNAYAFLEGSVTKHQKRVLSL